MWMKIVLNCLLKKGQELIPTVSYQTILYSSLAEAVASAPVPMTLTNVCLQAWAVFVSS